MPRSAEAPPSRAGRYHAPFVTLMELVASIEDGSRLGVGGVLLTRLPLAGLYPDI